jgi:hypothetical protein
MRFRDYPVVRQIAETGADDRVLDALVLIGPGVVAALVLVGRSLLTEVLAGAYLVVFVANVVRLWLLGEARSD